MFDLCTIFSFRQICQEGEDRKTEWNLIKDAERGRGGNKFAGMK
jgi:hypothetical protein